MGKKRTAKKSLQKKSAPKKKSKATQKKSAPKKKSKATQKKSKTKRDPNLYFQMDHIEIHQSDVLNKRQFKEEFIDLIVTSPPYNVGLNYESTDDEINYEAYLEFSHAWMSNCYLWSKPSARFCLNIPLDKNKGGQRSVGADLTSMAQQIGWNYHSTIIWNEGNISRRTAWGSWMSASAPYVIAPVELIVILYKGEWKKTEGTCESDISRDEFMEWTNGLWTFNGESKKRIGHPAPFPRELPLRCIKLFSYVDDLVFDPFLGSGTTLVEAFANHRRGVGLEIDPSYCEIAKSRLQQEINLFNQPQNVS